MDDQPNLRLPPEAAELAGLTTDALRQRAIRGAAAEAKGLREALEEARRPSWRRRLGP